MRKKIIAMALVGGRGTRLGKITKNTAKPAVSFGGKYRLIDFVLSNVSNSGIDTIGLVTQYEPHDLMKYISYGSTWDLNVNDGGVSFLTPYTSSDGEAWQKGTAHAIKQHFRFIDQYNPDHVLILSGDHIYKMDYQKMLDEHIRKNSDLSIATFKVKDNPSRYGIVELEKTTKKVLGFEEKPEQPKSQIASMGVYIFKKEVLRTLLNIGEDKEYFDFGKDIIPLSLQYDLNVYAYRFDGYFRDVGTVESLFEANMDLIKNPQFLKLHEYKDWPIYTKSSNLPPHHIQGDSSIKNSLISDGCLVNGMIQNAIISSGTFIDVETKLKNVIVFQNATINKHCDIENAIILENTVILEGTKLHFDEVTVVDNEFLWKLGEQYE